jgi:type II secretory pathway pseudopilin PulG
MEFLIVLVILAVVAAAVLGPLRTPARAEEREADLLAALEVAKEAKYREIRDAELDHRTGKLSDADFEALDGALRAEAVEILRRIDRAGGGEDR